jgi:hypothetical protein
MFRIGRMPGILGMLAAISIGVFLLVLAAGLALIVIPVAIATALVGRWHYGRKRSKSPRTRSDDIIEVDYRVIDNDRS